MGVERRGSVKQSSEVVQLGTAQEETAATTKPLSILQRQVYEAYRLVNANAGSAGVDGQSIKVFEE